MADKIIGRIKEKEALSKALDSTNAEFIAVYGRRRVGKTYLIEEYCGKKDFSSLVLALKMPP